MFLLIAKMVITSRLVMDFILVKVIKSITKRIVTGKQIGRAHV